MPSPYEFSTKFIADLANLMRERHKNWSPYNKERVYLIWSYDRVITALQEVENEHSDPYNYFGVTRGALEQAGRVMLTRIPKLTIVKSAGVLHTHEQEDNVDPSPDDLVGLMPSTIGIVMHSKRNLITIYDKYGVICRYAYSPSTGLFIGSKHDVLSDGTLIQPAEGNEE